MVCRFVSFQADGASGHGHPSSHMSPFPSVYVHFLCECSLFEAGAVGAVAVRPLTGYRREVLILVDPAAF